MAKTAKKGKFEPVPPPVTHKGQTTPLKKCDTCETELYDQKNYKVLDNFEVLETTTEKQKITEFGRVARVVFNEGRIKVVHRKCGVVIILGSGERIWDITKEVFLKWPILMIEYENREEVLIKLYEEQEREEKRLQEEQVAREKEAKVRALEEAKRQKEAEHDKKVGNRYTGESSWTPKEKELFK